MLVLTYVAFYNPVVAVLINVLTYDKVYKFDVAVVINPFT